MMLMMDVDSMMCCGRTGIFGPNAKSSIIRAVGPHFVTDDCSEYYYTGWNSYVHFHSLATSFRMRSTYSTRCHIAHQLCCLCCRCQALLPDIPTSCWTPPACRYV